MSAESPAEAAVVLDASAVLSYLLRERGWEAVQSALPGGLLGSVNLCEIVSKFCERGASASEVEADVLGLGVEIAPFSAAQAVIAAQLRPETRALGLSLGDRACLALGLETGAEVLTADAAWGTLPTPHRITVIR